MSHLKSTCYYTLLLVVFLAPSSFGSYSVLWDVTNGAGSVYDPGTGTSRYEDLVTDLEPDYTIQSVSGFGSLAGADIAVIAAPTAGSGYDVSTLQSFVSGGGGLLILADWNNYSDYADVASAFGISFTGPFYKEYIADGVTTHPVCDGITSIDMYWGGGLSVSGSAEEIISVTDGLDEVLLGASAVYGSGHVVVLSDSSLWASYESGGNIYDYYGTPDNAAFAANVFEYLATPVPEPATMALVATGLLLLRRRKRA